MSSFFLACETDVVFFFYLVIYVILVKWPNEGVLPSFSKLAYAPEHTFV